MIGSHGMAWLGIGVWKGWDRDQERDIEEDAARPWEVSSGGAREGELFLGRRIPVGGAIKPHGATRRRREYFKLQPPVPSPGPTLPFDPTDSKDCH